MRNLEHVQVRLTEFRVIYRDDSFEGICAGALQDAAYLNNEEICLVDLNGKPTFIGFGYRSKRARVIPDVELEHAFLGTFGKMLDIFECQKIPDKQEALNGMRAVLSAGPKRVGLVVPFGDESVAKQIAKRGKESATPLEPR